MVALSLVAAGLAWERVRARRTRSALAQLVVDLGASPPPGGLQGQLAVLLGDPTLTLLHSLDDGASWIDAEGRQAALPADGGRGVTRIMAGGREVSALVHRPGCSTTQPWRRRSPAPHAWRWSTSA